MKGKELFLEENSSCIGADEFSVNENIKLFYKMKPVFCALNLDD